MTVSFGGRHSSAYASGQSVLVVYSRLYRGLGHPYRGPRLLNLYGSSIPQIMRLNWGEFRIMHSHELPENLVP